MFKGKIYLYKNINGKEEKVEKDFDNEEDFKKYVNQNPEFKKMDQDFDKIMFPKSFYDTKNFFEEFDRRLFWDNMAKKWLFDELSDEFNNLFEKSKNLLEKK